MTTLLFTDEKHISWYLSLLRIIGTTFSFTSGAAGGIFAPPLSAGATVGATLSGWLHLSPDDTNILILSGMTAFLTGLTRTPFTSAILVLEMTDRQTFTLRPSEIPVYACCTGRKDKMVLRQIKRNLQMLFEFASVQINYPVIFLLLVSLCFLPSHFIYLTIVL